MRPLEETINPPPLSYDSGGGLIVSSKGRTRRVGGFLDPVECGKVLDLLHHALGRVPGV